MTKSHLYKHKPLRYRIPAEPNQFSQCQQPHAPKAKTITHFVTSQLDSAIARYCPLWAYHSFMVLFLGFDMRTSQGVLMGSGASEFPKGGGEHVLIRHITTFPLVDVRSYNPPHLRGTGVLAGTSALNSIMALIPNCHIPDSTSS
ncbi:unnamed protein product [Malus baccata var. baccata]